MTDDPDRRVAALGFLREWSAWMVGVETILLGFLVTLLGDDRLALGSAWLKTAALSFGASMLFAAWVLGGIPSICERLAHRPWSIYRFPVFDLPGLRFMQLRGVAFLQHAFFVLAVAALLAAVWQRQIG